MKKLPEDNPILESNASSKTRVWLGAILVITLIALSPTLLNGWVNWDDEAFVLNNPLLTELNVKHFVEMFSTSNVEGGYHPLTLLSWALDHSIDGMNPQVFHLTNLLLHLANVILVFLFVRRLNGNVNVALVVALFFGIHPMHIEAVAWITARKDVLFTLFYLLGLISYLKLNNTAFINKKHYFLCLLFFVLALLSKSMAFTFPLALLVIDFLHHKRQSVHSLLLKLPFFVLAILAAILSKEGQQDVQALVGIDDINFIESFFVGTYGTLVYLFKAFVPIQLSPFHPYPVETGSLFPWYYYASALPVLFLGIWCFLKRKKHRTVVFGLLFFAVIIGPVLQFIPVGMAVVAERFSYLSYLGLFYLMALGIVRLYASILQKKGKHAKALKIFGAIGVLVLALLSYQQSKVWKNGENLWSAVVEHYPEHYFGYACRANYWTSIGEENKAIADYTSALAFHSSFDEGHYNRGVIYLNQRKLTLAEADFKAALTSNPDYVNAHNNLGLIYLNTNRAEAALEEFFKAIALQPNNSKAYYNCGLLYGGKQQWTKALEYYEKAVALAPNEAQLFKERGHTYGMIGNLDAALADFSRALELNPNFAEAFYWRSIVYNEMGNSTLALNDALSAERLGYHFEHRYIEELQRKR